MSLSFLKSSLSQDIQREYYRLMKLVHSIPTTTRSLKEMDGTGGKVSVADLLAYQIGWGKCIIRWYEAGKIGIQPDMPSTEFSTWDYVAIAKHFYREYKYKNSEEQEQELYLVVTRILEISEEEHKTGCLDAIGVWSWCTLPSGKQWPLSKWIRVNTASPYKRAATAVKKLLKSLET